MNEPDIQMPLTSAPAVRPTLMGHIQISRIDHWFKNVFVLPGIIAAIGVDPRVSRRTCGLAS